jgi:tyrosine-protein kinase Etk/Wzc
MSNYSQNNGAPKNSKLDFNHYIRLLIDKKWWILSITFLISIGWLFVAPSIVNRQSLYDFSGVIRFDDPRNRSRVGTIDEGFLELEAESKSQVIVTTPFLNRIIDSLNLNIKSTTIGLSREVIFNKLVLEDELSFGQYNLIKNGKKIDIKYSNSSEKKENFQIGTLNLNGESAFFNIQGIQGEINLNVFNKYDEVEFVCIPSRYILEEMKSSLNFRLNRAFTLLNITYQNSDPKLGAKILNAVLDLFLVQSLEFKKTKTLSAMLALEEQVTTSKIELEEAENSLRYFREQNPHIFLTENTAQFNQSLISTTNEKDVLENNLNRVTQLLEEKNTSNEMSGKILIYQEILGFLESQNIAGIAAIVQQYNNLINQRNELVINNFGDSNPRMIEVKELISDANVKIDERLMHYTNEIKSRLDQISNRIEKSEQILRQTPSKELQLAKLQRLHAAKSTVYSNVLVRYNEIKTAHASITPDAYLLERAQEPIIFSGGVTMLIIKSIIYGLGIVIGLVISILVFLGIDFISHKARSVADISTNLQLPVISILPAIKQKVTEEDLLLSGKRMDPTLITIDYTPSVAADSFRNLRTKLIYNIPPNSKFKLVTTSFMPNEGKSFVSGNLAVTFAQLKKPTLLIDCDIRRGVLHNSFLCSKKPGISDFLARSNESNEKSITPLIQQTTVPNLFVLSCGTDVPNPTELLINSKLEDLIKYLEKHFQYIIIDTPPLGYIPDALILNNIVKNLIIVTRYGKTDLAKLNKKLSEYPEIKSSIKGIILNDSPESTNKNYNSYSYYRY